MTDTASTISIIGTVVALFGGQTLFLTRALDGISARVDRVEARLTRIEDTFLKDYGERITRLEERVER